jgi:hypothetical protein
MISVRLAFNKGFQLEKLLLVIGIIFERWLDKNQQS